MTRNLIITFFCFYPLLLFSQSWDLSMNYTDSLPDGTKFTATPDSLLSYYHPETNLSLEEIIQHETFFKPNLNPVSIRQGDILWIKITCTNKEDINVRYLFEVDPHVVNSYLFFPYNPYRDMSWSEIEICTAEEDSIVNSTHTGNRLRASEKPVRDFRNFFWLEFKPSEQKQIYIRLTSQVAKERRAPSLRIVDPERLRELDGFTFRGYSHYPYSFYHGVEYCVAANSLEFVIDSTQDFELQELKKHWDEYAHFARPQDLTLAYKHILWCRFTLINPDSISRYHLINAGGDAPEIEVYLPGHAGEYNMVKTGRKVNNQDKAIIHPLNLFDYSIGPLDTAQIYIKYMPIKNNKGYLLNSLSTGIQLFDPAGLMAVTRNKGLWKGFILGVLIFQLLYFLFRSFLEKNRLGLYYAIIILGFSMAFINLENFRNTFIAWSILFRYSNILSSFPAILFTGLFLFTDTHLDLRTYSPRIYKIQKFLLLGILIFSAAIILNAEFFAVNSSNPFFIELHLQQFRIIAMGVSLILYVVSAFRAYYKKVQYARDYLIAFSPFLLALLWVCIHFILIRQGSINFQYNLLYLGFISTSILFAVVGARRYNQMKIQEARADDLMKLNKAKADFYGNITHEFRTPLTVILGLANNIQGYEREKELIQKNGRELLDLVQQLLDQSKAESGLLELRLREDNIVPYLEYLISTYHILAEQKKVDLRFICEEEEIIMYYDRDKTRYIVSNLVTNAIKFTPRNGKVLVQAKKEGDYLILKIKDNGIGLSPEGQTLIFDRFYQASRTKRSINSRENDDLGPREQGSGIGLALVNDVIALLKGEISVESASNKGTTFTVRLPLNPTGMAVNNDENSKNEEGTIKEPDIINSEDEAIALVVEDNVDVQYYLERVLSPEYKVLNVNDGEEALERAIEVIPDIIISDVMMPRLDGYQLTQKLKEDRRTNHIPIILVTAKAGQEDKVKGLAFGADAYLTKPFDEVELKVRMKKLVDDHKKLQASFKRGEIHGHLANNSDPFLVSLEEILESHYAEEEFGIRELGQALHLSRMQVHRKLKALTGYSTSQYLNHFRLEKSKYLLADKHLTISEVAYSCGFGDPGYFSRLFSKKYQQSPMEFRNDTH